jgi:predicted ATPase
MKITELHVEGFRSLRDVLWRPGDLNVVIGPNASGKSNLLKALEMISASSRGELGEYVRREGGMEPLLWDGTAKSCSLRLKTRLPAPSPGPGHTLDYLFRLARLGQTSAYSITEELIDLGDTQGTRDVGSLVFRRAGPDARVFNGHNTSQIPPPGSVPEDETFLSVAGGPFAPSELASSFERQLCRWAIYQDFRTDRSAPVRQPNLSRLETVVSPDGSNLISVLHTVYTGNRNFEEQIDAAMSAAFGEDYNRLVFPPAADGRVQLRVRWKSLRREQSTADLSDGTLRFLFLLAVLANPNAPGVLAIDEPETGLHPSMMPIVAEYAQEASRHCQVILTTHSAEFLDAFTEARPTVTVARLEDGQTALEIRSGEELDYWLQEYTLGRLFRSGELERAGVPA